MQNFRYLRDDPGFCRTYYRGTEDRLLYCIQNDGEYYGLNFYDCTSEGEPNCARAFPVKDRFDRYVLPS